MASTTLAASRRLPISLAKPMRKFTFQVRPWTRARRRAGLRGQHLAVCLDEERREKTVHHVDRVLVAEDGVRCELLRRAVAGDGRARPDDEAVVRLGDAVEQHALGDGVWM